MNFNIDKKNKKIKIEREFAAPLAKVFAAWTQAEILEKWFAPKPWKAKTKHMNFSEGGHWLYAMVGPDGTEHWGKAEYKNILPLKSYNTYDAFCDENGIINMNLPRNNWFNQFKEVSGNTIVSIEMSFDKLEDLETIIKMGFKEGMTMALENLDEVFNS